MKLYGACGADGRDLLAWAAARFWGVSPLPPLGRGAEGKPCFPDHPHLQFNLSHSGALLLCALSARPVGVDIECIRPRREGLFRYALTEAEHARFQALGGDWPAFYTLWTRKEAWCKYTGLGLRRQWKQTPPENPFARSYAGPGWKAAVWGEEPPPDEIIWMEGAAPYEIKP